MIGDKSSPDSSAATQVQLDLEDFISRLKKREKALYAAKYIRRKQEH